MDTNKTIPQRDISIPVEQLLHKVAGVSILLLIAPLGVYWLMWGLERFFTELFTLQVLILAIPVTILFIVLHEVIHVLSWKVFGRLAWSDFNFGIDPATKSPYAHAHKPMTALAYRLGAIMPGIVVGIIPLVLALLTANAPMTMLFAFMTSASIGDFYVLWMIRELPNKIRVLDHPRHAGCIVIMGKV